jgi:hypothetical protein
LLKLCLVEISSTRTYQLKEPGKEPLQFRMGVALYTNFP